MFHGSQHLHQLEHGGGHERRLPQLIPATVALPYVWADVAVAESRTGINRNPRRQGLADAYGHLTFGLLNAPALPPKAFAAFMGLENPDVVIFAMAGMFTPTGAYDTDRVVNIGTNRWTFRAGLPITARLSDIWAPGKTTTLEVLPTLDLFTPNNDPATPEFDFTVRGLPVGKALTRLLPTPSQTTQDPLGALEVHLTHDVSKNLWVSLDSYSKVGVAPTPNILLGPDHLLFVLGLLLIVGQRWRVLIKTITVFTVVHSLTLTATTLGVWRVPNPPLEAAIALSILFLAPEIVRSWRGQTSLTIRHPWLVAFAFGLLHGAGLATALQQLGLPKGETLQALALFNLGVELGLLAFVAAVWLAIGFWRWRRWPAPLWLRRFPGYLVGSLGAYWVIERTMVLVRPLG